MASDSIGDGVEDYDAIALEVRSTRRQYLSVARLPCATVVIASVIAAWAALILTNRPVVAAQTAAIEAQSPIPVSRF